MNCKSIVRQCFEILLIVAAALTAGAQTQPTPRAPLPRRANENYWLMVDQFADRAVHFAYAKGFVHVHEGSLTDRQCRQYSRIAVDYAGQLALVKQAGVSAQSEFWKDVREYSISMIGAPGVPIPGRRTSKYWVTMGSETEDSELRQMVSLEIDETSSHFDRTGGHSPSVLKLACATPAPEQTASAQR